MLLSDDQILIRDSAREFAQREIAPRAAEMDKTAEFPTDIAVKLGELGFLGMTISEEWGGIGADNVSLALVIEEISAADGACGLLVGLQNSVVCGPINQFGSKEQKERFLRPAARGEMRGCFCLTEPQAGSDASNLRTRAELRGNRYIVNGSKQFISSGSTADFALIFGVTDPDAGKKGISAFIALTDADGYQVVTREDKLGQRASDTCQLSFNDLEVFPDMVLGEPGEGYRIALSNLEGGRIGIGAQALGIARAAYEAALSYAKDRESMGRPIIEHQAVAFRLADMATKIEVSRQMILHAATIKDSGRPALKEASMAKLFASEMAEEVCSAAIQIHGGYGFVRGYPVERLWRDVRVCTIYEGTSDVQR
ncbi:MAG: acyl-CoA dehydrogenase family protein, partial [Dehalococcoidia bacterium]|nr:acyl-CoA dehydrogenase family protein [Dehalococcoidia bacterium]